MTRKRALVPLAPGFEEIEAVTIIDVLRRAGVAVTVAGLQAGAITGSHGIAITPDKELAEVAGEDFDLIALPGGLPGSEHLRDDARVQELLAALGAKGRLTAAICAGPIAFGPCGIAAGRSATSYPGFAEGIGCETYLEQRVVVDDTLVTSRGPGTALEFALTLVERLAGAQKAAELEKGMLVARAERAHVV